MYSDEFIAKVHSNSDLKRIFEAKGITLKKSGAGLVCKCPFHKDKNPSMKAEKNFYCFGCGEKGDSIRLAEKILGIHALEAAYMVADEYGIDVSDCVSEKQKVIVENTSISLLLKYQSKIFLLRNNNRL